MGYDLERKDYSDISDSDIQDRDNAKARLIESIVYADFENKVLVGKCKAKDLKR